KPEYDADGGQHSAGESNLWRPKLLEMEHRVPDIGRYNLRVRVCNRKQRLSLDVFLQQPGTRNSSRNRKISRVDSLLGQRKLNLLVGDRWPFAANSIRSEEHTSELQSRFD